MKTRTYGHRACLGYVTIVAALSIGVLAACGSDGTTTTEPTEGAGQTSEPLTTFPTPCGTTTCTVGQTCCSFPGPGGVCAPKCFNTRFCPAIACRAAE